MQGVVHRRGEKTSGGKRRGDEQIEKVRKWRGQKRRGGKDRKGGKTRAEAGS